MKSRKIISLPVAIFTIAAALFFNGCGSNYSPEQKKYIKQIEAERTAKNEQMKNDPNSPFNRKGKIEFHNLNYFDPDPEFVFHSKLFEYEKKDSIVTQGTKGDVRKGLRWGYLLFNYKNKEYRLNVYEIKGVSDGATYYAVWFRDKTTNNQTYGVGRYLDFEKSADPQHVYQIDFNLAYNPYCAYSPNFSCTVPLKEDFIDIAVEAGEKKFHD